MNNNKTNVSMHDDLESLFNPPEHNYLAYDRFTSGYYQDYTQQQYAIHRAFEANNFNYLRKLPDSFQHKGILNNRIQRVKEQVDDQKVERTKPYEFKLVEQADKAKQKKLQKIGTLGFFQLFPYKQSPYDLAKELANVDYSMNIEQRKKISDLPFRPSDVQKKAKYQDPFKYNDKINIEAKDNTDYLFPFHNPDDDYNQFKESQTRKRIISESNRLAGPFIPSMKQQTLGTTHKSKIQQILTDIEFTLKKHLQNYAYIIGVNKKDHIEILFEDIHQKDMKLKTFMSILCEHQILTKYKLKRDIFNYGILENQYILFTVIPPWVQGSQPISVTASTRKSIMN